MKLSTLFLLILIPTVASSQSSNYSLDSYVNPDYKRKELIFFLETSSTLTSQKTKQKTSGIETYNYDANNKTFSGDFISQFYQVANSVKKQAATILLMNIEGGYLNNNYGSNGNNIKNKDFVLNMNFNQEGYYYVKDKKFIEFSPYGYLNYTSSVNDYENSTTTNSNGTSTNLSFRLGLGKGRIEQVEDACLAIYILSDLKDNGSLKNTLSPEEVNMLAQQITSIKNKRRFDSRIKLIEEISTVDSFLTANGHTDAKNAPYFTTLYDNWMYAGLFKRAAGSRISAGLSPGYYWSHNKQKNEPASYSDFNNYYSQTKASVYVSYRYEKPANLYLQHSVYTEISGDWLKQRGLEKNTLSPRIYGEYSLGYYPNTRTHIKSTLFVDYFSAYNDDMNNSTIRNGLRLDLYYYLSPQLRLNANGLLSYIYANAKDKIQDLTNINRNPHLSFNIGLQYSIF